MKIVGLPKLEEFKQKHADSRGALDSWRNDVELFTWNSPNDIKQRYPSVSFLANNTVIFNIKGNKYRLVIKVKYQYGIVMVEWVGTHAEYNNKKFT